MKKSRICWIRILFPVFAVLIFSVFLLTIKVNAAGDENLTFDDIYPIDQNNGNLQFSEAMINQIMNDFDSENNYIFAFYSDQSGGLNNVYISYTPKSLGGCFYAEIQNDITRFRIYTIGSTNWNSRLLRFNPSDVTSYQNININNNVFLNLGYNDYSYISNFILKTNNTSEARTVLRLRPIGHAPKPPRDQDPVYSTGDSVDPEVPVQSNGQSDANFLAKTFQYFGNLINGNLNEFKNNLYENLLPFISIFSDLYNLGLDENGGFSVGGVFTSLLVPSSQQIIQAVIDHDDFDFIGTSKVIIADAPRILSQLYNVTSTPIFHVPSCIFHGVEIGDFDISFAWFAPYKVYYDVIVSTFLVIAYIYWIFISMHGHIRTTYTPGPQEEEYWRY